jgi:SAM-dependent methyltransferase
MRAVDATVARAAFAALAVLASAAHAQGNVVDLGPDPYVPTPPSVVARMLELAQVKPGELVIDLGSGDGRLVIAAAKNHGARGVGFEIDRSLIREAEEGAREAGVADRVRFEARDLFEADLTSADVLTLYLLPVTNEKLRPKILAEMRPGTRVVAHQFHLGDWTPDTTERVQASEIPSRVHDQRVVFLWTVPARIAGRWTLVRDVAPGGSVTLELDQRYQIVAARGESPTAPRFEPVRGANIRFALPLPSALAGEYAGVVANDAMHGDFVAADGTKGTWRATRQRIAADADSK